MTLALDTDVLVHWANADCEHHEAVRERIGESGAAVGVVPSWWREGGPMHVALDTDSG